MDPERGFCESGLEGVLDIPEVLLGSWRHSETNQQNM